MKESGPSQLTDTKQWDQIWEKLFDHYQNDLRHAFYIR